MISVQVYSEDPGCKHSFDGLYQNWIVIMTKAGGRKRNVVFERSSKAFSNIRNRSLWIVFSVTLEIKCQPSGLSFLVLYDTLLSQKKY